MALGPGTIESSRDVEEMSESHRGMSQIIWSLKLWGLSFMSDAETTTAMLCATSSTSVGGVNISDDIQADGPMESEKGGVAEPHSETVSAVSGDSPVDSKLPTVLDPLRVLSGVPRDQGSLRAEPLSQNPLESSKFYLFSEGNELCIDPELEIYGLVVNTHHRLLICIRCQYALLPGVVYKHVLNHSICPAPSKRFLQGMIEKYGLVETKEEFVAQRDVQNTSPISGIQVQREGFWCGQATCSYACGTESSIRDHCNKFHASIQSKRWFQGAVQQVYLSPQSRLYIRADISSVPAKMEDTYTVWLNSTRRQVEAGTVAEVPKSEIPPWLRKGLFEVPPEGKPFGNLKMVVESYFRKVLNETPKVPRIILSWLCSYDGDYQRKYFIEPMEEKTVIKYSGVVTKFILFLIRTLPLPTDSPSWQMHVPPEVSARLIAFSDRLNCTKDPEDGSVQEELHRLLKCLYLVRYRGLETVRDSNPLEQYLAFINYRADQSFNRAGRITQTLAALTFSVRAVALREILTESEMSSEVDTFDAFEELKLYLCQGQATPMSSLLEHFAALSAASHSEAHVPEFQFTDSSKLYFTHKGAPYSVPQFRTMLADHVKTCAKILHKDLLLDLPWDSYSSFVDSKWDDPSNEEVGYSFLKDERNPIHRYRSALMALFLQSKVPGVREFFGHTILPTGSNEPQFVWNAVSCRQWLKHGQEFLRLLSVVIEFVQGQPGRGTELMTTSICNRPNCPRTLFFHNGQVVNALRANKRQSQTGTDEPIPRFFPAEVSLLLNIYLSLVRPVEVEITAAIFPEPITRSYKNYLFTGTSGVWGSQALTENLIRSTKNIFGPECNLGVAAIRQITIFLYCHHCQYAARNEECKEDWMREWNEIGDMQAGHSTLVADCHYGVEERSFPLVQERQWRALRAYSDGVHRFWGMEVANAGKNASEELPLLGGRSGTAGEGTDFNAMKLELYEALAQSEQGTKENLEKSLAQFSNLILDRFANTSASAPSLPSRPPHTASLSRLLFTWSEGSLTSFKSPTQLQALEAIREGKDHMMVVMRTGGGKSLLWQSPAATFLSHQVTLVVVPFVALKEDIQRYMGGLCEEWTKKTETVKGKVSVFLVSLEQLKLAEFRAFVHMLKNQKRLARIVVDEAHVILTAGDYRGDVQHLPHLYTYGVPVTLLSATIPPHVTSYVKDLLGVQDLRTIRENTMIPPASIQVHQEDSRTAWKNRILDCARSALAQLKSEEAQGIVFCRTGEDCEMFAAELGVRAYHSGVPLTDRKSIQEDWAEGRTPLVVATTAFGTGLDGKNVRSVIHAGIPYSLIDYIQEMGRALRDNRVSYIIMFVLRSQRNKLPEGPDYKGVEGIHKLVFEEKECRRLALSGFVDGQFVTCAAIGGNFCDLCCEHMGRPIINPFTQADKAGRVRGSDENMGEYVMEDDSYEDLSGEFNGDTTRSHSRVREGRAEERDMTCEDGKQQNSGIFNKFTPASSSSSKGAEYDHSSIFTCLTEKGKGTQGDTEGDDDEEMEYYINSFTDEDLLSVGLDGKGKSIRSDTMTDIELGSGGTSQHRAAVSLKRTLFANSKKRGVDEVSPPVIGEDDRSQRRKLSYKMPDASPRFLSIGREVPISGYTSLGRTGYTALIPASSSSSIGRGGKNWNSPTLNIRTGQASFSDRIPSSSAGPSIMAQQQQSITAEGDFERFGNELEGLMRTLKGSCMICCLIHKDWHQEHTARHCPRNQHRLSDFLDVLQTYRCPPKSQMCYGCLMWTGVKKFQHGMSKTGKECVYPDILPPLLWVIWEHEETRNGVVAEFEPKTAGGIPVGSRKEMEEWLLHSPGRGEFPKISQVLVWIFRDLI
ncbi:hypothetical protein BU17DRAFT_102624 [Hysterangium stoloniferum]|nr:hypothetical protein BU17DRAFT_102624 [Hysterangium stoloniferum]